MATKRSLTRRYNSARKRIKKEEKLFQATRSRLIYWKKAAEHLEFRLELLQNGQTEMTFK